MVSQNKVFSFKIKRQAKNVFPSDVERTLDLQTLVALVSVLVCSADSSMLISHILLKRAYVGFNPPPPLWSRQQLVNHSD